MNRVLVSVLMRPKSMILIGMGLIYLNQAISYGGIELVAVGAGFLIGGFIRYAQQHHIIG